MKKSIIKMLSLTLAVLMLFVCASCKGNGNGDDDTSSPDSAQASSNNTPAATGSKAYVYFDTDVWKSVPMISQELINAGYTEGGEACQMVLGLTFDSNDGKLGFFGTDVAGVYRTTDGGSHWTLSSMGWQDKGGTGFAIDPTNKNRVLGTGSAGMTPRDLHIHLSTNGGDTWKAVQTVYTVGFRDTRTQFAFDKSSYDASLGYCKVVYYSQENNINDRNTDATKNDPCIRKSTDGGETWTRLNGSEKYGGGDIYVNSSNGHVYAANSSGAYISKDGGATWTKMLDKAVNSMNCVITAPNNIYITTDEGFFVSKNGGSSFDKINSTGYPSKYARAIKVSPVNQNNMVLQMSQGSRNGNRANYYSKDGGATWTVSVRPEDNRTTPGGKATFAEGHYMPTGTMMAAFAWSPVDANTVFTCWKHVVKSTDGGATYKWSNAGFAAIYVGSYIRFNINNPNIISLASQDFNGSLSTDGGKTWKYMEWYDAGWGGYSYGSYALDANHAWAGTTTEWASEGGAATLSVTHDGGKTFEQPGIAIKGYYIGYGALGSDSIGFMGEWRTEDKGYTWTDMTNAGDGCLGVFAHDTETGRLWGYNNKYYAVYSDDNGKTWTNGVMLTEHVEGMAFDSKTKKLYITTKSGYLMVSQTDGETQKDRAVKLIEVYGGKHVVDVAVDPNNSNVIYATQMLYKSSYDNDQTCFRSLDGGKTWTCITRFEGDGRDGVPYGTRASTFITINPETSELWSASGCHGIWKIAAPKQ